ncbi:hypothetical protein GL218_06554 [Daldinia childiae]|uniref:uncharacterized protein n=1 Tax=Daldinia childiae TaxID=326645 RepID=UPI001444E0FB|nr:uncharacterized protein GL218_06554 [Daldinia childiae]KAF3056351.1 hypothetical protein GL218_06554 [Daldinia childiae]
MAHLPEGWESDYDGCRWLYRFKTTGLTQYHFPRPGDEFPELVGIGFGPLDLAPGNKFGTEYKVTPEDAPNITRNGGKTALADGKDEMGATGYFDPDNFMYFGLNDVSPVGNESSIKTNTAISASPVNSKSNPLLAELESTQRWSPVGFVSELASGDTVKCAEELAPIEMDATQIAQAPLQTNQNSIAELPTERSQVEEKAPVQHPVRETMKPVEEYPLVSASFAYPPLKTTVKPVDGVEAESPRVEQKVIASQRPPATTIEQNEYETWKPTHGISNEEPKNPYRNSMMLSSISVLQSQNTELGPINQKRHSLSGPVESSGENHNLPGVLRQPSDPRTSAIVSTPSPKVETSPIPTVLQPAVPPTKVTQDDSQPQPSGPPGQPLYQVRPNQAAYQMPPGQPGYQGQGVADPYAAIGATIGGALTALTGSKTDTPASTAQQHQAANPEQNHTQHSEPQHESYSEQQHGGQSGQHHAEQSEQNHGSYSEQQYTNQSEQNHESYSGQHQEANNESYQQTHAEQNYTSHGEQQNNGYTNEDRQTYSEPAPAESHSTSEAYYAPQPESTIINNTTINNIENTAMAESTQTNVNYTDNTQISDTNQMNMNYTDNSQMENTANMDMMNTETTSFTDTAYMDTTNNNTSTEATAFAETTYMDSSNTNMDMNADMTAYTDTTAYADASYTDTAYMDANATYIDVNVDMNVDINQTTYMGDEMSMMTTEENFSMDASASYMDTSTVDYSGGDWGGGEW